MPFTIVGMLLVNRTSWFAEEGITPEKFPATWEDFRAAGRKLKVKNRPLVTGCGFFKAGEFGNKRRRSWVFSRLHPTG